MSRKKNSCRTFVTSIVLNPCQIICATLEKNTFFYCVFYEKSSESIALKKCYKPHINHSNKENGE